MSTSPVKLSVKVVPGASRTEIAGWLGESLKLRVSAPPERGKANLAVETLMCDALGLPSGSVRVISGGTSPRKTLEIHGMRHADIVNRLSKQLDLPLTSNR
jgi:uncharacterized protein (TIGR00251 family)